MAGAEQAAGYTSKCDHTGMTSFYKIVGKSVGYTAAVCTKGGWPEWLRLSKTGTCQAGQSSGHSQEPHTLLRDVWGVCIHLWRREGQVPQFCSVSCTPQAPQSIFQDAFSAEKAQWHCQHKPWALTSLCLQGRGAQGSLMQQILLC